jgi:hypothetical protein
MMRSSLNSTIISNEIAFSPRGHCVGSYNNCSNLAIRTDAILDTYAHQWRCSEWNSVNGKRLNRPLHLVDIA